MESISIKSGGKSAFKVVKKSPYVIRGGRTISSATHAFFRL